jgi:hypothetical protein
MDLLQQALRGAQSGLPSAMPPAKTALVIGGGGTLGSALLAEALSAGRFLRVHALITEGLASAMRGFVPMPEQALSQAGALDIDTAFIVFERARHSHGRDDAFVQPEPGQLLSLAQALRARGVMRLLVVVPHAPSLLPGALKSGLASLDEAAVAALGFEHLVFLRSAQNAAAAAGRGQVQRLADWWLSQLRWMVPQDEQPVRAVRLAALVVQLARLLPASSSGTRVVPPALLSRASAAPDAEPLFQAWLAGAWSASRDAGPPQR